MDDVTIELAHGIPVGVKGLRGLLDLADNHVLGQMGVDGLGQGVDRHARVHVGVGHLADGVDTGIGSAAGVGADALAVGQPGQSFLQDFLDRAETGLGLPAVKVGAVVTERQADVSHIVIRRSTTDDLRITSRRYHWKGWTSPTCPAPRRNTAPWTFPRSLRRTSLHQQVQAALVSC